MSAGFSAAGYWFLCLWLKWKIRSGMFGAGGVWIPRRVSGFQLKPKSWFKIREMRHSEGLSVRWENMWFRYFYISLKVLLDKKQRTTCSLHICLSALEMLEAECLDLSFFSSDVSLNWSLICPVSFFRFSSFRVVLDAELTCFGHFSSSYFSNLNQFDQL